MFPSGIWYNELGSQMQLNISGNNVWGSYNSAVGNALFNYPLTGQINYNLTLIVRRWVGP